MDSVITEAVALLDEAGESGLTFRALAERLGGGVASIYWYVSSKDELLDRASDHVVGNVLEQTAHLAHSEGSPRNSDPINDMREIAISLFDAVADRPWLGAYFMRDTSLQPNALTLFDRLGRQAMRLDLTRRQRFHAVSAVMGFVIGTAADLGQEVPKEVADGSVSREDYVEHFADQWRGLDANTFPYLQHIVEEFASHDDSEQFRAGLDLLLAGIRLQAEGQTGSATS